MPLRVTYCANCGRTNSRFMQTIEQLKLEHPDTLRVVELECMAACSESPVAMIEYDFFSRVVPEDFYDMVTARLAAEEHRM